MNYPRRNKQVRHIVISGKWLLRIFALLSFVFGILIVCFRYGTSGFVNPYSIFAPISTALILLLVAEVIDDL